MTAFWTPDQQALAPYLAAKAAADKCVSVIAGVLQPGMSEQDCEQLMRDWLRAHHAFDPARPPKARFSGKRRRRIGLNRPGRQRLKPGMSYILHCDAVLSGYAAKASISGPQDHPALADLHQQLNAWRTALPAALADGESPLQLGARFPQVRQFHRLAPIIGNLPEGDRIGDTPLIAGLWQWQFSITQQGHSVAGSEFLVMDDHGPRWLKQGLDTLQIDPSPLTH